MAKTKVEAQNNSQNPQKPGKGKSNEPAKTSRLEELQSLSDAELKERYLATFAKEADESLDRDALIVAINDGAPKPPPPEEKTEDTAEGKGNTFFGNKDSKRSYPLDKTLKGKVVVRQYKVESLNGGMVEVPNTSEVQSYYPEYYEKLLKNNFFGESRMQVEVLHQPK
jgi:hypothetical protein